MIGRIREQRLRRERAIQVAEGGVYAVPRRHIERRIIRGDEQFTVRARQQRLAVGEGQLEPVPSFERPARTRPG